MIAAGLAALELSFAVLTTGTLTTCGSGATGCPDDMGSFLQTDILLKQRRGEQQDRQLKPPRPADYWRQVLHNANDLQYSAAIKMGGQNLDAVMDTGSFEILAFSKTCSSCGRAARYDSAKSATFTQGMLMKEQAYGSGTTMTTDGVDRLVVGPFALEHQDFWIAEEAMMPVLASASFQAIVGLGPPGEPQQEVTQILQQSPTPDNQQIADIVLAKNDSLLRNLGTQYLSACLQWATDAPGYLIWNDVPPQEQTVPFKQIDVITGVTWSVVLTAARLEGPNGTSHLGCTNGCEAIMDTGTSLIAVPTPTYNLAQQQLSRLDTTCSNLGEMPDLVFELGGHKYSLPPQSYIGVVSGTLAGNMKHWMPGTTPTTSCELLLMDAGSMGSGPFGPTWIVGMPFFRYYYTTFDLGAEPLRASGRKIWTAPASASCEPVPESGHEPKMNYARAQLPWSIDGTMIRPPMHHKKSKDSVNSLTAAYTTIDLRASADSNIVEK